MPYEACCAALAQSLRLTSPQVQLDEHGYVSSPEGNLIDGVFLRDFEFDLRQGAGKELEGKFLAAHSSSALAVNTFAPFRSRNAAIPLPVAGIFPILGFEQKCPIGLQRGTPPHLDVLAGGPDGIVGIESKCLEFLSTHGAVFAPAYNAEITDERRNSVWFEEMLRLLENPERFRWLDAAQLVKHALGLSYTFRDRPTTLLYVFWEPLNPTVHPVFGEHRSEIARFAASVSGGMPAFSSISYPELWKSWDTLSEPEWLSAHVTRLWDRYGLSL